MDSTLLLNADARPVSLLPISSICWQQAIKSLCNNTTEVLHYHEEWTVHSPSVTMQVPAVLILKQQINVKRNLYLSTTGISAWLIFVRDNFTCQYCSEVFPRNQLTLDHVLPRKYGGREEFTNLTTCCSPCNSKRGHDVRIQPKRQPYHPTYFDLIKTIKKSPVITAHPSWNWYLGWSSELVQIIDPKTDVISKDISIS